jgi:hypothetical protein
MVNGVAWLTVSNSGIYGGCWTETTDLPATTPRFQLGDSVVLSVDGLFALNLVEGIPS